MSQASGALRRQRIKCCCANCRTAMRDIRGALLWRSVIEGILVYRASASLPCSWLLDVVKKKQAKGLPPVVVHTTWQWRVLSVCVVVCLW